MINHFISGVGVAEGGYSSDLFNPSSGRKIGSVLNGTADELDMAVQAAHNAFLTWSTTGLGYRANLLLACRQKVMEHRDELIDICVVEAGKTFSDAAAEVDKAKRIIEELAKAAAEGRGAAQLDGRMIDAASERMAENIVNIDNLIQSKK